MTIERTPEFETVEDLFGEPGSEDSMAEHFEVMDDEFACRGCGLIFSCSCREDDARSFCSDCTALAAEAEPGATGILQVDGVHHPCPACGALVIVPEHGDVTCGFVCPSCRVRLSMRGGHVRLSWDHHDAVAPGLKS